MTRCHLDLVSHWRIDAPAERVWNALADPRGWPAWWPQASAVRTLHPGGVDGVGQVHRIRWKLPPRFEWVVELGALEARPPERLRSRSRGTLDGEGIWLLHEEDGRTDVTSVWRVRPAAPGACWLLPLAAPWLRWRHAALMRAGEAGLERHLACGQG